MVQDVTTETKTPAWSTAPSMASRSLPTVEESPTVTVEVAAHALGLSRNSAYLAVRNGELPSVRIGHRVLVLTGPLRRMLALDGEEESDASS